MAPESIDMRFTSLEAELPQPTMPGAPLHREVQP